MSFSSPRISRNMTRTWLIDSRGIAGKVKNPTSFSTNHIRECGAYRLCPQCYHRIDNSDVSLEWPGLPAGVKFDPSDIELLEHLAGKVGLGDSVQHAFIDEFIPTLAGDEGIYFTHPENLPGVKKDGSSVHFFHKTSKAYATGGRKRRKIHGQSSSSGSQVRWHKTGKTKAVVENGVQKGCKKIMVLYKSSKKGSKPDKFNWVMHQYHLGTNEDEKEGEYVVSKIFYQQHLKQTDRSEVDPVTKESLAVMINASPTTPTTHTPNPPRLGKRPLLDEIEDENDDSYPNQVSSQMISFHTPNPPRLGKRPLLDEIEDENDDSYLNQVAEFVVQPTQCPLRAIEEDNPETNANDTLLCDEVAPLDDMGLNYDSIFPNFDCNNNSMLNGDASGISDFDDFEFGPPPDLADLQFGSQDSFDNWLGRL